MSIIRWEDPPPNCDPATCTHMYDEFFPGEPAVEVAERVKPSAYELWRQANGDSAEYRRLMVEHGLLIPLKPGEKAEPLPCGWPNRLAAELAGDLPYRCAYHECVEMVAAPQVYCEGHR